jgi:hypothetical protein
MAQAELEQVNKTLEPYERSLRETREEIKRITLEMQAIEGRVRLRFAPPSHSLPLPKLLYLLHLCEQLQCSEISVAWLMVIADKRSGREVQQGQGRGRGGAAEGRPGRGAPASSEERGRKGTGRIICIAFVLCTCREQSPDEK